MRDLLITSAGLLLLPLLALAQTVPPVIEYYHVDVVGNVRAVTDQGRQVIERHDYLPFGEEGNPQTGNQPLRFTGKARDTETGFDYFGARYHQAKWARFTTTDPVYTSRENLTDPQRWNRYAYARNNPFRFVDPDGREVRYANSGLEHLFTALANLYPRVRETLELYQGSGKPDLHIEQGPVPLDRDGTTQPSAGFAPTFAWIGPATDLTESGEGVTEAKVIAARITFSDKLKIDRDNEIIRWMARHELGHADAAARDPVRFIKLNANDQNRNADGAFVEHDKRTLEREADAYAGLRP